MSTTWGSPCCSRNTSCCLSWSEGAERERLYRGAPSFLLLVGQLRARGWLRPTSLVSRYSETLEFGPPLNPRGKGRNVPRNDGNFVLTSNFSIGGRLGLSRPQKRKHGNEPSQDEAQKRLEARRRGEEGKIVVPNRVREDVARQCECDERLRCQKGWSRC